MQMAVYEKISPKQQIFQKQQLACLAYGLTHDAETTIALHTVGFSIKLSTNHQKGRAYVLFG
jgi:hypothetical protein